MSLAMPLEIPETMPSLTTITGRFQLVPLTEKKHYADICKILEDDRIWSQGFGDTAQRPLTDDERVDFIDNFMRADERFIWAVIDVESNTAIGTTGLASVSKEMERCHIGRTLLSTEWWGQGVNHETKLALMDWLFECGAGRIECDVDVLNHRSTSSLTGFGFTLEGTRRRSSQRWDGTWRDMQVLSVIREEWEEIRIRKGTEMLDRFETVAEFSVP
jgi:RimJ/RimL family protein N-acetyltransferase